MNRGLMFHKEGSFAGWFAYPFTVFFEWLGPVVETCGYLLVIIGFALGIVSLSVFITFMLLAAGSAYCSRPARFCSRRSRFIFTRGRATSSCCSRSRCWRISDTGSSILSGGWRRCSSICTGARAHGSPGASRSVPPDESRTPRSPGGMAGPRRPHGCHRGMGGSCRRRADRRQRGAGSQRLRGGHRPLSPRPRLRPAILRGEVSSWRGSCPTRSSARRRYDSTPSSRRRDLPTRICCWRADEPMPGKDAGRSPRPIWRQ